MNTFDLTPLPGRPDPDQYRKQAKELVKLAKAGDAGAIRRVRKYHPRSQEGSESGIVGARFALADAQLVLAREHGFESWAKFAKHIAELARGSSPVSRFELAAEAIVAGDAAALESSLHKSPGLVRARSTRAHRATLLHYCGANGVENFRQKTPKNAVEIARILLEAGAKADAVAEIYGKSTTLGLAASSVHPRRAGVQIALMETLLDYGADVDGARAGDSPLIAALRNGRREAAEFLAGRGARLDLEGAAGVGRVDIVESFFDRHGALRPNATREQMEAGFLWACEYGRNEAVDFLLGKGVDIGGQGKTGLTGLHWAVVGGRLDTIRLLLERGASIEARNVYGGTALGTALWSAIHGEAEADYVAIVETLIGAGAKIEDGMLEWLARQEGGSASVKERIAEALRFK